MKEPGFKGGFDALEAAFELASMLIEARTKAKLSKHGLAKKMGTSQSTIARLESGAGKPSLSTRDRRTRMPVALANLSRVDRLGFPAPLSRRAIVD